ncbi:MAG: hypothetical protein EOO38_32580 [Cytophagaceae bacterium]|nr:MAG: hypothetical protein EOO38_32580 [Cytophagaceae bacterium]
MFFSKALLVACSAIAAIAAPTDIVKRESDALAKRATGSSTGTSGGFYYSYWTDGLVYDPDSEIIDRGHLLTYTLLSM